MGFLANGVTAPTTSPYSNGASEAQAQFQMAVWPSLNKPKALSHFSSILNELPTNTIHQLPHLILLTSGLQMSLHL
jgi:hypothetical protein